MFAVVDRQQWNTQRAAEPPLSPELQQMFALARRMGYEMRPIARRFDAPRRTPDPRSSPNKDYRAPFRPRDYSRTKCFSCGQLGHTQVRCPKPDSSLRQAVVFDPGFGQRLLASLAVSGGQSQDGICDTFRAVPVQSYAVWPVQCSCDLRAIDGSSTPGSPVESLPGLP